VSALFFDDGTIPKLDVAGSIPVSRYSFRLKAEATWV
jgi:hypothetical protein